MYGHIIDPATGPPVENGIASVSVGIASEGKLCDALSAALLSWGWKMHRITGDSTGIFEMILIMEDGDIYLTLEGIRDEFSLNSEI